MKIPYAFLVLTCLIPCMVLAISCGQPKNQELEDIFMSFPNVPNQKLTQMPMDSLFSYVHLTNQNFEDMLAGIPTNSLVGRYLDTLTGGVKETKTKYLSFAYFLFANNQHFDKYEVKRLFEEYDYQSWKRKEKELFRIAKINDAHFGKGDTISLTVEVWTDSHDTIQLDGAFYELVEGNRLPKNLTISAIILGKDTSYIYPNREEPYSLDYRLLITSLNYDKINLDKKPLVKGDTVDFSLNQFGKLFGKNQEVGFSP